MTFNVSFGANQPTTTTAAAAKKPLNPTAQTAAKPAVTPNDNSQPHKTK